MGESGSSVGLLYMVTETLFWVQKNKAPHKGLKTQIAHLSFILVVPSLKVLYLVTKSLFVCQQQTGPVDLGYALSFQDVKIFFINSSCEGQVIRSDATTTMCNLCCGCLFPSLTQIRRSIVLSSVTIWTQKVTKVIGPVSPGACVHAINRLVMFTMHFS